MNEFILGEELVTVEVDFDLINKVKESFDIKKDRQETLYVDLLK